MQRYLQMLIPATSGTSPDLSGKLLNSTQDDTGLWIVRQRKWFSHGNRGLRPLRNWCRKTVGPFKIISATLDTVTVHSNSIRNTVLVYRATTTPSQAQNTDGTNQSNGLRATKMAITDPKTRWKPRKNSWLISQPSNCKTYRKRQ